MVIVKRRHTVGPVVPSLIRGVYMTFCKSQLLDLDIENRLGYSIVSKLGEIHGILQALL